MHNTKEIMHRSLNTDSIKKRNYWSKFIIWICIIGDFHAIGNFITSIIIDWLQINKAQQINKKILTSILLVNSSMIMAYYQHNKLLIILLVIICILLMELNYQKTTSNSYKSCNYFSTFWWNKSVDNFCM